MTLTFPAIPLWRYAYRVGYRETAFFGINHPDNARYECRQIWTAAQREAVNWALLEAQDELEAELRYTLVPKWQGPERHTARCPVHTGWGYVIAPGVMLETTLAATAALDYTADPATLTIDLATTPPAEVHFYLPGSDIEVWPSGYTLVGTVATYTFPWARLVAEAYLDNPPEGWDYANAATWRTPNLMVRALHNDTATQGILGVVDYDAPCYVVPTPVDLCIVMPRLGTLSWHAACVGAAQWLDLYYLAGLTALPRQAEDAVIRLAHAKMPEEPCGCEVTQRLWARDRKVPDVYTRERINCPFGLSDGAWFAWRVAQSIRLIRGGVL